MLLRAIPHAEARADGKAQKLWQRRLEGSIAVVKQMRYAELGKHPLLLSQVLREQV
jgi:hypothetical protein